MGRHQPQRARKSVVLTLRYGFMGAACIALLFATLGRGAAASLFSAPGLAATGGVIAGWMAVTILQRLLSEAFRGFSNIRLASIFGGSATGFLTGLLALFGFTVIYAMWGSASLVQVVSIAFVSGAAGALLGLLLLTNHLRRLESDDKQAPIDSRMLFSVAWPLLISNLAAFILTQSDIWILSAFESQEHVALYGAAIRLVGLVTFPLHVLYAVIPPVIAQLHANGEVKRLERILRTSSTVTGSPAFAALLGLSLFGPWALGVVYGEYYKDAASILTIISLGRLVDIWTGPCDLVLALTGHQHVQMITSMVTGTGSILAGAWAASAFGSQGLAIAIAISVALHNFVQLFLARRLVGVWTHASLSPQTFRRMTGR